MGLITKGYSLAWSIIKQHAESIRARATQQLIRIYDANKGRCGDPHLFGDEVEYIMVRFDNNSQLVQAALHSHEMLDLLETKFKSEGASWCPETGSYMLESIPGQPYGNAIDDLLEVEKSMSTRRRQANEALKHVAKQTGDARCETQVLTITSFPSLGCGPDSMYPTGLACGGPKLGSAFLPDDTITGHARYERMQPNTNSRHGGPPSAFLPVYKDTNTTWPYKHQYPGTMDIPDNHIYVDTLMYGFGCACLQITMQAKHINQARRLYDQLAVVAPLLMAVSAATPLVHGHLLDTDCRCDAISKSSDDRTPYEMGQVAEQPGPDADGCSAGSEYVQPKPRYSAISMFLDAAGERYNDVRLNQDAGTRHELVAAGMDEQLAAHFAFLFTRDPIMVYDYQVGGSEPRLESDLFECLQSTNWNSMRFKPPPPNNRAIGWRVEFRTLEAQFTDFENAAFAVFVVLLGRAVMADPAISFYIPISKSDENMERAQRRGAVAGERFWFRKNVRGSGGGGGGGGGVMSLAQIVDVLANVVDEYLDAVSPSAETRRALDKYIQLIKRRADGTLLTNAAWIRRFVDQHPAYKHDSVVAAETSYDLLAAVADIASGKRAEPLLHGDLLH
ncbi:GCS-domain-containing protein [Ramicandelaber brevisporus]|nr:GCS-domain-containing protein [Ramicandelaber brevisporus]